MPLRGNHGKDYKHTVTSYPELQQRLQERENPILPTERNAPDFHPFSSEVMGHG